MKKAGSEKKEPAPVAPPRTKGPGDLSDPESPHHGHKLHLPKVGKKFKDVCLLSSYTVLGIATIVVSFATIMVTGLGSAATKVFDAEQSSRLVAMIVLTVSGAVTLSMVIYSVTGAFRKKTRGLHASGIVLVVIAIIQALIIGVAIHVSTSDEMTINRYLSESFAQAKMDKPRHVMLWKTTQSGLKCCGLNSPEDYRDSNMPYYFPPNVPVSCCPSYDHSLPTHNQERQRELCKVNGTYYDHGCRGDIIKVFVKTSELIVRVVIVLIGLELVLAGVGYVLINKYKKEEKRKQAEQHEPQQCSAVHIKSQS